MEPALIFVLDRDKPRALRYQQRDDASARRHFVSRQQPPHLHTFSSVQPPCRVWGEPVSGVENLRFLYPDVGKSVLVYSHSWLERIIKTLHLCAREDKPSPTHPPTHTKTDFLKVLNWGYSSLSILFPFVLFCSVLVVRSPNETKAYVWCAPHPPSFSFFCVEVFVLCTAFILLPFCCCQLWLERPKRPKRIMGGQQARHVICKPSIHVIHPIRFINTCMHAPSHLSSFCVSIFLPTRTVLRFCTSFFSSLLRLFFNWLCTCLPHAQSFHSPENFPVCSLVQQT